MSHIRTNIASSAMPVFMMAGGVGSVARVGLDYSTSPARRYQTATPSRHLSGTAIQN